MRINDTALPKRDPKSDSVKDRFWLESFAEAGFGQNSKSQCNRRIVCWAASATYTLLHDTSVMASGAIDLVDRIHGQSADVFEDTSVAVGGRSHGIAARCIVEIQRVKLRLGSIVRCPSQDVLSLRRRSFAWQIQEMAALMH